MAKKKTAAELAVENRILRAANRAQSLATVGNTLIKWGSIVAIAYFIHDSVNTLAGKTTLATIGINLLGSMQVNTAFAWLMGTGGVVYGLGERKLRQKTIKRLQGRIQKEEKQIDPGRTSSRLTVAGDTNPADR